MDETAWISGPVRPRVQILGPPTKSEFKRGRLRVGAGSGAEHLENACQMRVSKTADADAGR